MATFANVSSELDITEETDVTRTVVTRITTTSLADAEPVFESTATTLSPGHAAILEMHANSQSNALIYIAVVLGLYILGMSIVVIKYIRTERYEARLTRLFQNLVQRDRFFGLSRRRSSLSKCVVPGSAATRTNHAMIEDDLPMCLAMPVPEIHLPVESESSL